MTLVEFRRRASQLSGGTSDETVKHLVFRLLTMAEATGNVIDFGAGKGELLAQLLQTGNFTDLAGTDLMDRPAGLPREIAWWTQDLNEPVGPQGEFDVAICSETIEHLENPRQVFRNLHALLRPGGVLILTMPNQECIRSLAGLVWRGHFTPFLADCYPAHITALLHLDLRRICAETGFDEPRFCYSDRGGIPKLPFLKWQSISFGLLRGRLFSDTLGILTRKCSLA